MRKPYPDIWKVMANSQYIDNDKLYIRQTEIARLRRVSAVESNRVQMRIKKIE